MEVTHREKTEEELKAIEEARKTKGIWMGESKTRGGRSTRTSRG